jgi:hypothetical protein
MAANKNTRKYRATQGAITPEGESKTSEGESNNGKGTKQLLSQFKSKQQELPIQCYIGLMCPKTIPKEIIDLNSDIDKRKSELDHHFALVIRTTYEYSKATFCGQRLLHAVTKALQNAMPETRIVPYSPHSSADPITSENEVFLSDDSHREYV